MKAGILLVGLVAGATLAAIAVPAMAKGDGQEVQGQVVVTGPGLSSPMFISGQTTSYDGVIGGPDSVNAGNTSDFEAVLLDSGVLGSGTEIGWYELTPDISTLGPAYSVTFMVDVPDAAQPIVANLYPFAPERPMLSFDPKQKGLYGQRLAQWWSAPPALVSLLIAHGLPATPPLVAPASRDLPQPANPHTWLWVWTIAALAALMAAGAVLGRRRPTELA